MNSISCPKHQTGGGPCYCQQNIERLTAQMFEDIKAELMRARIKFHGNRHQLTAFNEEAGELNQAMLEHHYGNKTAKEVYWEAVQAAAMAIRVGTEGDSTFKYVPPDNDPPRKRPNPAEGAPKPLNDREVA